MLREDGGVEKMEESQVRQLEVRQGEVGCDTWEEGGGGGGGGGGGRGREDVYTLSQTYLLTKHELATGGNCHNDHASTIAQ